MLLIYTWNLSTEKKLRSCWVRDEEKVKRRVIAMKNYYAFSNSKVYNRIWETALYKTSARIYKPSTFYECDLMWFGSFRFFLSFYLSRARKGTGAHKMYTTSNDSLIRKSCSLLRTMGNIHHTNASIPLYTWHAIVVFNTIHSNLAPYARNNRTTAHNTLANEIVNASWLYK